MNILWTDKYAPKSLSHLVLNPETKELLQNFVANKNIPNLIFYSEAGRGKTTLAKILISELNADSLILNASLDTSIDTIRDKVVSFCSTSSFGKMKIVLCDEADRMSEQALDSLKGVIEKFQHICRFIFTTNHINKLPDALLSRCKQIPFENALAKDIRFVCENILTSENKKFDRSELKQMIKDNYPDVRQIIHTLELNSQTECFKYNPNVVSNFEQDFLQIIFDKSSAEQRWQMCREFFVTNDFNDWDKVYTIIYNNIEMFENNYINVSILIAKYLHQSKTIPNREINLMAFLAEILKLK